MWVFDTTLYQIYPLGMLGCPFDAPGLADSAGMEGQIERHRIRQLIDWAPYLGKLGIGAILLNPVFSSDTHGYNTRDLRRVDCRLGTLIQRTGIRQIAQRCIIEMIRIRNGYAGNAKLPGEHGKVGSSRVSGKGDNT